MNASEAAAAIARLDQEATRVQTRCGPDARMVWRRWGSGPAIILVHGGAGSWLHWIRNIEPLSRTRTVWAPDLPGFGDSDLPADNLDADTIAPLLQSGAMAVLQGASFDLIGFSFGALVAGLMAAQRPPGLRRLVMVSVGGMGLTTGSAIRQMKPLRGVTDPRERAAIQRANMSALMLPDVASIDDLALEVQARSASRERVKNRRQVLTDVLLTLPSQWECPAFGIWGRQDPSYREQIPRLLETIPRLKLREHVLIDRAGHWLQYQCADEFHRILGRFLETPVAGAPGGSQRPAPKPS